KVLFRGDEERIRAQARALLAQLAVFHSLRSGVRGGAPVTGREGAAGAKPSGPRTPSLSAR
ncbi:hypothetical protein AB0O72_32860, partial [Streptomyces sp. NPDC088106]|uniref:hypothetical protein n=1 Tax=Streptomyces sp. NPDC088106 TaxID=3154867 RepID=UPI0034161C29